MAMTAAETTPAETATGAQPVSTTETETGRALRADAKRNRDKILAAARESFAETGVSTSLEAVARRAGVGIGTLYRHFPTRQALLEAVYLEEIQQFCSHTNNSLELEPWEGFTDLSRRLVAYLATKKALASELLAYVDKDATFFQNCRGDLFDTIEPVLKRAQDADELRADTDLTEVVQLLGGISKIDTVDSPQREHILQIALDGLRCRH